MLEGADVLQRIVDLILNPLILLIFSLGFLLFLWGLLEFLWNGANPQKHEAGKQHMIWGIVGMFIMVAFWGIIMLIVNTFGFDLPRGTRTGSSGAAGATQQQFPQSDNYGE